MKIFQILPTVGILTVLNVFVFSQGYSEDSVSKSLPLGTIGCKVDEDLCNPEQFCHDDNLFGTCHSVGDYGVTYDLTNEEFDQLGRELIQLKSEGYNWKNSFTQCIIQNTLLAFAERISLNVEDYCDYNLAAEDEQNDLETKKEIARVLEQLLDASSRQQDFYPNNNEWENLRSNSNKRDEFVEVHKYFDQSKGLKRNDYPTLNYMADDVGGYEDDSGRLDDSAFGSPGQIKAYIRALDELSKVAKPTDDKNDFENKNEMGTEAAMTSSDINGSLTDTEDSPEEVREEVQSNNIFITPPDEKAVEDLLAGNLDPHDMELDQLKRVMKIVEGMIESKDILPETNEEVLESKSSDDTVPLQSPDDNETPVSMEIPDTSLNMDKKTVDTDLMVKGVEPQEEESEENSTPSASDVVDMRYAFVKLDRPIDEIEGGAFLEKFATIINLPLGAIDDVMTLGNKITFEVLPNTRYNASLVASKAVEDDTIKTMKTATGLTIVNSGIGNENQVDIPKNDNKYVVLTFIMVGCIAGILLAVVVIYMIKRQSRSKEKLAELADNAEGNEASRDYQDLCRQRMQSKTSEKPEPLHASSRIGSVSDQVRSPSSRSSTSSWSEEPVQTNMDISTGHIVLSYMEDHLNNQDRLDREWEALSNYEAEPSNSKIATDAANMRKNRYGDILPYDHSRVILAPSANVSGSDYINANFITDHDPRNPAFIVTQGPLPHTVADFWQMVWEQGSVVIVMLSKLTENGTAMCHRYWPEEGSDLYHIYEVHLVSEHIWCDDYLVRSFYLKNLQTNETRTVTQFHFITWPNLGVPGSIKALLDFRRKVNKSYRGRSCPIIVHCSDGCNRAGTYILIDMVLNRMAKGAKEIDMAATLEHIRDQRMTMVKTKEQFQFALGAVAEEVHAILKALPQ